MRVFTRMVFITEVTCVYCEVGTEFVSKNYGNKL